MDNQLKSDFVENVNETTRLTTDKSEIQPPIKNQIEPNQEYLKNLRSSLTSEQCYMVCPYCERQTNTQIKSSCSASNTACCVITTPIIWFFFQCFRGKDYNCQNTLHICNKCHREIGTYNSC